MANPTKKGDVTFTHNFYDVVGETLWEGVRTGRLDPRKLGNISANIGVDLGDEYGVNLGYNELMAGIKQDLKISITKKF